MQVHHLVISFTPHLTGDPLSTVTLKKLRLYLIDTGVPAGAT